MASFEKCVPVCRVKLEDSMQRRGGREDAQGDLEHVEFRQGCLARVIYLGVMHAAAQA